MQGNKITPEGAENLLEELSENETLTEVDIGGLFSIQFLSHKTIYFLYFLSSCYFYCNVSIEYSEWMNESVVEWRRCVVVHGLSQSECCGVCSPLHSLGVIAEQTAALLAPPPRSAAKYRAANNNSRRGWTNQENINMGITADDYDEYDDDDDTEEMENSDEDMIE